MHFPKKTFDKIGTYKLDETTDFRQTYETACNYHVIRIPAGTYDVVQCDRGFRYQRWSWGELAAIERKCVFIGGNVSTEVQAV